MRISGRACDTEATLADMGALGTQVSSNGFSRADALWHCAIECSVGAGTLEEAWKVVDKDTNAVMAMMHWALRNRGLFMVFQG
jgi:hypothetical protein